MLLSSDYRRVGLDMLPGAVIIYSWLIALKEGVLHPCKFYADPLT
jgi:hypothetical protein